MAAVPTRPPTALPVSQPSQAEAYRWGPFQRPVDDPLDALHLSSAEHAGCHLFVSCDDRLLRLARRTADRLRVDVADPTEAVRLLERGQEE